jgi:hypothetical protein
MNKTSSSIAFAAVAVFGLVPVIWPALLAQPVEDPVAQNAFRVLAMVLPASVVVLAWKVERKPLLILALCLLSWYLIDLHLIFVDAGHYFPTWEQADNTQWQLMLHRSITRLEPNPPHSYRFLPDTLSAWVEWGTGSYVYARAIYRLTVQFALLFAIHRLAKLYLKEPYAFAVVLLYAVVYPGSIRYYAGQLTDPLSHLSFVLAFIFLETGEFGLFAASVLLGALAKESIAIMPIYYLAFEARSRRSLARGVALAAACAGELFLVRRLVMRKVLDYKDISGVTPGHVIGNLLDEERWSRQLFFLIIAFLPFAAIGWKAAPRRLKELTLVLVPGLVVSNIFFSWFHEGRNLIPATVVLAILAVGAQGWRRDAAETAVSGPRR